MNKQYIKTDHGDEQQQLVNEEVRIQNIEYRLELIERILRIEEAYCTHTPEHLEATINARIGQVFGGQHD